MTRTTQQSIQSSSAVLSPAGPCAGVRPSRQFAGREEGFIPALSAWSVFRTSDGALTRRFYAELSRRSPIGVIAMNLFRAQKYSKRAKRYGFYSGVAGRSFRSLAYDRKGWALRLLTGALQLDAKPLNITWGWGRDSGSFNPWVLYVELPDLGQVSFHSPERYEGPDYPGEWDGQRGASEHRIIEFAQRILGGR